MDKLVCNGPKGDKEVFFLLIQTLPTFLATWILILTIFILWIFLASKVPDFETGPGPGLGRAWPGLGQGFRLATCNLQATSNRAKVWKSFVY